MNFPALLFLVSSSAGPSPLRGDTELLLCPEDLPEATAASLGAWSPRRLSARPAPPRRRWAVCAAQRAVCPQTDRVEDGRTFVPVGRVRGQAARSWPGRTRPARRPSSGLPWVAARTPRCFWSPTPVLSRMPFQPSLRFLRSKVLAWWRLHTPTGPIPRLLPPPCCRLGLDGHLGLSGCRFSSGPRLLRAPQPWGSAFAEAREPSHRTCMGPPAARSAGRAFGDSGDKVRVRLPPRSGTRGTQSTRSRARCWLRFPLALRGGGAAPQLGGSGAGPEERRPGEPLALGSAGCINRSVLIISRSAKEKCLSTTKFVLQSQYPVCM